MTRDMLISLTKNICATAESLKCLKKEKAFAIVFSDVDFNFLNLLTTFSLYSFIVLILYFLRRFKTRFFKFNLFNSNSIMPARTASPKQIKGKNKSKKKDQLSEQIDPRQEEINQLIRERDEIRSKFNTVCSKLIENVIVEDYPKKTDEFNNQPCDLPLENLLNMIDDISYYRTALLEIYQENQDAQKISVDKKISQLARDQPDLFRKLLTMQQRLSFVIRERDLWKENAQNIQIMYATIGKSSRQIQAKKTASNYKELITSLFVFEVDQLEMGAFKKVNRTNDEILHAHRLKLEDVCRKFSSARLRSSSFTNFFCFYSVRCFCFQSETMRI